MKANYYGQSLTVEVKDGQLVIAIGVQTLAHSASYSDWANPYDEQREDYIRTFAITDAEQFAKDVQHAMLSEREDGSSPLSDFLDAMMQAALDDGSTAVEYEQVIKHGTTSPLETWAASPVPAKEQK